MCFHVEIKFYSPFGINSNVSPSHKRDCMHLIVDIRHVHGIFLAARQSATSECIVVYPQLGYGIATTHFDIDATIVNSKWLNYFNNG